MIDQTKKFFAFAAFFGLLLMVACTTPAATTLEGEAPIEAADGGAAHDNDTTQANAPAAAEPAGKTAENAGLDVLAGSQEIDSHGLEVGFTTDGHAYKGDPSAPVLIEEFSDFQCPFCTRFYQQTLPGLLENQVANGDAVLVFYDFPLGFHPLAVPAANAVRCAGAQGAGAYWQMHDMLFERFGVWDKADTSVIFTEYAGEIGLNEAVFSQCWTSSEYGEKVDEDSVLGRAKGVSGTPAFFINGHPVIGAQPITVFNEAINAALEGKPVAAANPGAAPSGDAPAFVAPAPADIRDEAAFILGDPDAPITIVEFTDFQCPFCAKYNQETLPKVLEEMVDTGRVKYVFKDLPLDGLHPDARSAAEAARCAGEQDAYLEMHDALFNFQDAWVGQADGGVAGYIGLAANLSLDTDAFAACIADGRYDGIIEASVQEANSLGINGTPNFFVNGWNLIRGAQPFEAFDQIVSMAEAGELEDRILESAKQQYQQAQQQPQQPQQPPPPSNEPVDIIAGDSYAIGDPNAPVTIIEFTDFQCPFCVRHFEQTFPQIMQNYVDTGKVRYIFKDFPLTSIHPQAVKAAEAARCAIEQDAYLEMHSQLFSNQRQWSGQGGVEAIFIGYADALGLDQNAFSDCLESGRYTNAINDDLQEGSGFGVRGTPAFFVNGLLVSGAQPYSVFQQIIDQALSE